MSTFLFTYGTLQPGLAPADMAAAVDTLQPVGEGWVRGVLYDLGEYPGAVLDDCSESRIYGRVFRLPEDAEVLRELDAYEEFYPEAPAASQFVRRRCSVTLASGGELGCWIYVYNRETGFAQVLSSGRFAKR